MRGREGVQKAGKSASYLMEAPVAEEPCQIEIADRDRYRDRKYGYSEHGHVKLISVAASIPKWSFRRRHRRRIFLSPYQSS